MSETRQTTVKTEFRDGMKIVTTTEIVTTPANQAGCGSNAGSCPAASQAKDNNRASSDEGPEDDFQRKSLDRHNYYRKKHGVPALEWSKRCAAEAQQHADKMARSGNFAHSHKQGFGENLFMSSGSGLDAEQAVDCWYNEIKDYRFGQPSPRNFAAVGHFTQVVWSETTHVGMAYATRGNSVYVCANYTPPGNMMGQYHQFVNPPQN